MRILPNVLVYISGPINPRNGKSVQDNVSAGTYTAREFIEAGIPAYSPHAVEAAIPIHRLSEEEIVSYDCGVLDFCTHIYMMLGSEHSRGCKVELAHARQACKIVLEGPVGAVIEQLLRP